MVSVLEPGLCLERKMLKSEEGPKDTHFGEGRNM